jgi:hypothetical protein
MLKTGSTPGQVRGFLASLGLEYGILALVPPGRGAVRESQVRR